MDLQEGGLGAMEWIDLAQNGNRCGGTVVKKVIHHRVL